MTESYITSKNILYGWGAIAGLLEVHPYTAMKYEKSEGLPVRRFNSGRIYAFKSDIEKWLEGKGK